MDVKMAAAAVAVAFLAAAAMQGLQDTVQALFLLAAVVVGLQAVQAVLQFRAAGQLQTTVQGGMEAVVPQMLWMASSVEGLLTKVVCSSLVVLGSSALERWFSVQQQQQPQAVYSQL